jgi:hypothetical protein
LTVACGGAKPSEARTGVYAESEEEPISRQGEYQLAYLLDELFLPDHAIAVQVKDGHDSPCEIFGATSEYALKLLHVDDRILRGELPCTRL